MRLPICSFVAATFIAVCSAQIPQFLGLDKDAKGFDVASCLDGQLDIGLLIDSSGSISYPKFEMLRKFLVAFFGEAPLSPDQIRLSALVYSLETEIQFYFSDFLTKANYKDKVLKRLSKLKYKARLTNTTGALQVARNTIFNPRYGDREDVPDLAILFSDGNNNQENSTLFKSADELKNDGVYIAGIAIGKELSANPDEIRRIASNPAEVIFIRDFTDLDVLRETIAKKMCDIFKISTIIKVGKVCYIEGREVIKRCRRFLCVNKKWTIAGYSGCPRQGKCIKFGSRYERNCDISTCSSQGNCANGFCAGFSLNLIDNGCIVNGLCVRANTQVFNKDNCATYECKNGQYIMIEQDCEDDQGNCRKIGYRFTENCITKECMATGNGELVEFRAVDFGCSYKGRCIKRGAAIQEKCNTLVCSFDDRTGIYDVVLSTQGCKDGNRCRKLNDVWKDMSTCTRYKCVFRNDRMKIVERSIGCKDGDSCAQKGSVTQNGCTKYVCQKNGEMTVSEVGCEFNGQCKALNSSWRVEGQCMTYRCLQDYGVMDAIVTYVENDLECHDLNGNCIKPGQTFSADCKTYKCQDNGQNIVINSKCKHRGKCYAIGAEWIDDIRCKHFKCRKDKRLGAIKIRRNYGCKDENQKCFRIDALKTSSYSCVTYKCYDDHILRQESCEYKGRCYDIGSEWIDNEDCLKISCSRDEGSSYTSLNTEAYGCFQDNVCRPPGYTYSQNCQDYKCEGYGRGFEVMKMACPWKNKCKNINETWFDRKTCRKYGCFEDEDGVDIDEVTYGCKTDDRCIRSGRQLNEGCIKYKCNNGKLETTFIGCEYEDGCMKLDEKIFDEKNCVAKKCVIDKQGDNYVSTKIKERWGCLEHGVCYKGGSKKIEGCLTYKCKSRKRDFQLIEAACEWRSNCYALNSTWDHPKKCIKFTCTMNERTGLPKVRRKWWGCKDQKGKCHPFGHKKTIVPCVVSECQKRKGSGPTYYPVEVGCKRGKKCKPVDSTWVARRKCVRKTCQYEPGSLFPEKVATPYGCKNPEIAGGKCKKFGFKVKDDENPCVTYECTPYETYAPIETGCHWKGKCYPDRAVWRDPKTCYSYRCESQNIGSSRVKMHTVIMPGCKGLDGKCVPGGTRITDGCTEYVCDTSCGGLMVVSEGCEYKGDCKPRNSTWFDPEVCTDFTCQYNSDLRDLFIVEIEKGCKDDNGRCYDRGQRKREECNVFVCNGKSNLMPRKTRCEWKGTCKEIGASWKEGCVTYTCRLEDKGPNFVKTRIDAVHGCVSDGICYGVGQIRKVNCLQETCMAGGRFQLTSFGCKNFDGSCMKGGDKTSNNCVDYMCSPKTWSLQPIKKACVWKNGCKDINSVWTERRTCKQYKCQYDPRTLDAEKVEITQGCKKDGKCIKEGNAAEKDCITYRCDNGVMIPESMGCEYQGKCYNINEVVYNGCDKWICRIKTQAVDFVATAWDVERGCYTCSHECIKPGEEYTEGCRTMRCIGGGRMEIIADGCMTYLGCAKIGDMVEDLFEGAYECGVGGKLIPFEVKQAKTCDKAGDRVYELHEYYKDAFCTKWECLSKDGDTKFYPVSFGCSSGGKCYDIDQEWHDDDTCNYYKCVLSGNYGKVVASYGCPYEGRCFAANEKFDVEKDCTTRKCVVRGSSRQIKIMRGACREPLGNNQYKCRRVNEVWRKVRTLLCFDLKCYNRNGNYTIEFVKQECADTRGQCHSIGQSGFSAYNKDGDEMDDCECKPFKNNGVKVDCARMMP